MERHREDSVVCPSSLLEDDIREATFFLLPYVSRYLCQVLQVAADTKATARAGRASGARIFDQNTTHLGRLSFPKWLAPSSDNERAQLLKSKSVKFLNILLYFLLSLTLVMEPFLYPYLTLYKIHYIGVVKSPRIKCRGARGYPCIVDSSATLINASVQCRFQLHAKSKSP